MRQFCATFLPVLLIYGQVMLFYDIVITFGDEVEKIWKKRFSGATVLWVVVRLAVLYAQH